MSSFSCLLTSGANNWSDQVYNQFWLQFAIQTAGFNALAATSTKVPLTDKGVASLVNVVNQVLQQGVNNGFLTPGAWPAGGTVFGNPNALVRNVADCGFYTYAAPVATLTQGQLQSRTAPTIQTAALAAGAVQKVAVNVNIAL